MSYTPASFVPTGEPLPFAKSVVRRMAVTESQSQKAVVEWARWNVGRLPQLALLHSVPNGAFLGRDRRQAAAHMARLKAEGLREGVPDLFLPAARAQFHGLYIEMKRRGERLSGKQSEFIQAVQAEGYCGRVCFDAEQAIAALEDYLAGDPS